jgi:hypothetical protein
VFKTDNLILTNGGSVVTVSNYVLGANAGTTNTLALTGGTSLTISNAALGIGNDGSTTGGSGTGSATLSNATVSATVINVGSTAGGLGALTVQTNASVVIGSNLTVVSSSLASTSSVVVSGGVLTATNGTIAIGPSGSGTMLVSAGTAIANQIKLGGTNGSSSGSLIVSSGGYVKFLTSLSANSAVIDPGGVIDGNGGGAFIVAEGHDAGAFVTGGIITNVSAITVGYMGGYTGTLTVSQGGWVQATNNFIVGDCASTNNAIGLVTINDGALYVTNASHTANLDIRNGLFTLNPGATLVVDNLIITNACGHFVNNGGAITNNNRVLSPNQDADGDGMSNTDELRAGTDPLNPNSNFRLLDAVITNGHDVRLDWTAVGGSNYAVQLSTNLAGGQAAGFRDLNTNSVGGIGETTGSYVHVGGATNRAGFYRVRLWP